MNDRAGLFRPGWIAQVECTGRRAELQGEGRVAWSSSCSRNAHDKNVLVRRAQSRIDQATLESEIGDWEVARSWDHPSHPLVSDRLLRLCWTAILNILREYSSGVCHNNHFEAGEGMGYRL